MQQNSLHRHMCEYAGGCACAQRKRMLRIVCLWRRLLWPQRFFSFYRRERAAVFAGLPERCAATGRRVSDFFCRRQRPQRDGTRRTHIKVKKTTRPAKKIVAPHKRACIYACYLECAVLDRMCGGAAGLATRFASRRLTGASAPLSSLKTPEPLSPVSSYRRSGTTIAGFGRHSAQ